MDKKVFSFDIVVSRDEQTNLWYYFIDPQITPSPRGLKDTKREAILQAKINATNSIMAGMTVNQNWLDYPTENNEEWVIKFSVKEK